MKNKIIIIVLIIFVIMRFLVATFNFGITIYSFFIIPLAFYFFPIKPFLEIVKLKKDIRTALYTLASYFVMSGILCFSTLLFISEIEFLSYSLKVLFMINAILFYVDLFKENNKYKAFLHFLIMCFYNFS